MKRLDENLHEIQMGRLRAANQLKKIEEDVSDFVEKLKQGDSTTKRSKSKDISESVRNWKLESRVR